MLYSINNITIAANDVTLNCNSSWIASPTKGKAIIYVGDTSGVTIHSCYFRSGSRNNYNYAIANKRGVINEPAAPVDKLTIYNNNF